MLLAHLQFLSRSKINGEMARRSVSMTPTVTYNHRKIAPDSVKREPTMTTHFITAEIDLQENPLQLQQAIEAELEKRGEPLRWAVTAVDEATQTAQVEAVVTVTEA